MSAQDEVENKKSDLVIVAGSAVQEVLQKEVFTVKDIEILFQCKQNLAYKVMKEIKDCSNRLNLSGRVHKKDYLDYINRL